MQLTLTSPVRAATKAAVLSAVVYALAAPSLAPLRPEIIDAPLSRYHAAVNQTVADLRPGARLITEPLRQSPHFARQRVAAMLRD
ncbi:hypothetical protein [Stappia sp.]|uniref:hypothetical protein n=1 Tax=Stappia sp. TaxID=1870903 RepID=UPI0032D952BC